VADSTAYFCGEWMPLDQVRIDPLDRGFLVGDCVFDVARTFDGRSFRMREHVDRLYRSLKYVRIDPGLSPVELDSTSPCLLPVTRVDRRAIGDGKPGPVVGRLLRAWSELVGLDIVEQACRYAPRERQESKAGS
jgi:branched-chain amino acid aminotransferase